MNANFKFISKLHKIAYNPEIIKPFVSLPVAAALNLINYSKSVRHARWNFLFE
jgi:hypothetical protein